jgi:site-specific DNA-methyltransferase (adenine-specific)
MEVNRVIQGDCLEVMKDMPDKSIDMILTSPPYDNLRKYKGYTFNFEGIAKEIYRVLKDGGVCVWVVGDATIKGSETGTSFKQALYFKDIGFNLHDTMIWRKTDAIPNIAKNRYTPCFEYMFIFSKGSPKAHNIIEIPTKNGGKKITRRSCNPESMMAKEKTVITKMTRLGFNIWENSAGVKSYGHPAVFPETLAERHILSWSNEGDTILDPMAGSGTTLKMAKKNNRKYIGIEIAPEYIEIINKRLKDIPMKLL